MGWVLVACDVGQGDALVLNTGAGPGRRGRHRTGSEGRWTGCLSRLGVRSVPLVVLTHFHADHVDGLPAVLAGRATAEVEVTATEAAVRSRATVHRWADARRSSGPGPGLRRAPDAWAS